MNCLLSRRSGASKLGPRVREREVMAGALLSSESADLEVMSGARPLVGLEGLAWPAGQASQ